VRIPVANKEASINKLKHSLYQDRGITAVEWTTKDKFVEVPAGPTKGRRDLDLQ